MSRNSKARRKARKERAPSQLTPPTGSEPWGQDAPLTPQERSRVLSRFGGMAFRSFTAGFVPIFESVRASNPEELDAAVEQALSKQSSGKPAN